MSCSMLSHLGNRDCPAELPAADAWRECQAAALPAAHCCTWTAFRAQPASTCRHCLLHVLEGCLLACGSLTRRVHRDGLLRVLRLMHGSRKAGLVMARERGGVVMAQGRRVLAGTLVIAMGGRTGANSGSATNLAELFNPATGKQSHPLLTHHEGSQSWKTHSAGRTTVRRRALCGRGSAQADAPIAMHASSCQDDTADRS